MVRNTWGSFWNKSSAGKHPDTRHQQSLKDGAVLITDQRPPRSKDRFGTFRVLRAGLRPPQWRLVGWLACLPLACSGRATWLRPHSRSKGFIASLSLRPLCLGVAPSASQVFRFSGFLPSEEFPTRTRRTRRTRRPGARRCESWSYFPGLGAGACRHPTPGPLHPTSSRVAQSVPLRPDPSDPWGRGWGVPIAAGWVIGADSGAYTSLLRRHSNAQTCWLWAACAHEKCIRQWISESPRCLVGRVVANSQCTGDGKVGFY